MSGESNKIKAINRFKEYLRGLDNETKDHLWEWFDSAGCIDALIECVGNKNGSPNVRPQKMYTIGVRISENKFDMIWGPSKSFVATKNQNPVDLTNDETLDYYILRLQDSGQNIPVRKWVKDRWLKKS